MAKQKLSYICSECGHVYPKWVGRCTECGEWNTITEQVELPRAAVKSGRTLKPKTLGEISADDDPRRAAQGVGIARKTMRVVTQNVILAIGLKAVILILCQIAGDVPRVLLYVGFPEY